MAAAPARAALARDCSASPCQGTAAAADFAVCHGLGLVPSLACVCDGDELEQERGLERTQRDEPLRHGQRGRVDGPELCVGFKSGQVAETSRGAEPSEHWMARRRTPDSRAGRGSPFEHPTTSHVCVLVLGACRTQSPSSTAFYCGFPHDQHAHGRLLSLSKPSASQQDDVRRLDDPDAHPDIRPGPSCRCELDVHS